MGIVLGAIVLALMGIVMSVDSPDIMKRGQNWSADEWERRGRAMIATARYMRLPQRLKDMVLLVMDEMAKQEERDK